MCCRVWADVLGPMRARDFENDFEIPPHFRCGRCQTVLIVLPLVKFPLFRCWITGSCALSFYHDPFMCASVYRTEMSEHGVDTLDCKDGWWERFLSK